jgi:hypothetical protein
MRGRADRSRGDRAALDAKRLWPYMKRRVIQGDHRISRYFPRLNSVRCIIFLDAGRCLRKLRLAMNEQVSTSRQSAAQASASSSLVSVTASEVGVAGEFASSRILGLIIVLVLPILGLSAGCGPPS